MLMLEAEVDASKLVECNLLDIMAEEHLVDEVVEVEVLISMMFPCL